MASSSNSSMENHPGSPSHPKDLLPFDATPTRIAHTALLALPFISILIGVSSLHPTKPIYAIYSPNTASLQYVHGDGTPIDPLSICPLLTFNNGDTICSRQRLHMDECMKRSARYYEMLHRPSWNEDGVHKKAFIGPFTNEKSVKEAMTYVSDLRFGPSCMTALRTLPPDLHLNSNLPDRSAPCVSLTRNPIFDCSVHHVDFTYPYPHLDPAHERKLLDLFQTFIQRYKSRILYPIFKKAAYVLSGMEKRCAIYWQSGREHVKTQGGWTVDDFLVRFAKYEQFTKEWKFWRTPSPIAWLEAEMADEMRRERMGGRRRKVPWMGLIDGIEIEEVLGWKALSEFYWDDGEEGMGYPRFFAHEEDDEDGGVDDFEVPLKKEELEETEMPNGNSHYAKYFGELRKRRHGKNGKNGKRGRQECGESSAIKRAKSAALNMISSSQLS
ncbi:hypothetical protein NHQ30_003101 [Ciborinia camelliae]|nr:hypothetical protein NHQ30_003101 [Ciborinia camelliae]